MKGVFILLMAACLFPVCGSARLGETREQCENRYGKPVEKNDLADPYGTKLAESFKYRKGFFEITIVYHKNKTGMIIYRKIDGAGGYVDISEDEIGVLLQANKRGDRWYGCTDAGKRIAPVYGGNLEAGSDGNGWISSNAIGVYDRSKKILIFLADEYVYWFDYGRFNADMKDF